jgi:HSP20 family protein
MGVIDTITEKVGTLLPTRRERRDSRDDIPPVGAEVLALRDNLDRWLERFFEEPWGFRALGDFQLVPSASVHETDTEVVVTAEIPGLDKADVELTITPEGLVIRGEKREEKEDARGDFHVSERRYGSFARTVPLPDGIDIERANARVERGVLTVRFPKLETRKDSRRRIPVRT